jgi:hypothetical protein
MEVRPCVPQLPYGQVSTPGRRQRWECAQECAHTSAERLVGSAKELDPGRALQKQGIAGRGLLGSDPRKESTARGRPFAAQAQHGPLFHCRLGDDGRRADRQDWGSLSAIGALARCIRRPMRRGHRIRQLTGGIGPLRSGNVDVITASSPSRPGAPRQPGCQRESCQHRQPEGWGQIAKADVQTGHGLETRGRNPGNACFSAAVTISQANAAVNEFVRAGWFCSFSRHPGA